MQDLLSFLKYPRRPNHRLPRLRLKNEGRIGMACYEAALTQ
jgi:hypothetical protein